MQGSGCSQFQKKITEALVNTVMNLPAPLASDLVIRELIKTDLWH